jgi:hypothetical protein
MKNLRSILSALALLLMATAVQAQQPKVTANVPFDFFVGDYGYRAGEYSLKSIGSNGLVQIDNAQGVTASLVLSNTCENLGPSTKTTLVFHRMGDNYFLYQVWIAGHVSGREFPRSRTEMRLAENQEKPELVIVAANISQ